MSAPLEGDCDSSSRWLRSAPSRAPPNECAARRRLRRCDGRDLGYRYLHLRMSAPLGVCAAEHFSKTALLRRFLARAGVCERHHAAIEAVDEGNHSNEKIVPHIES